METKMRSSSVQKQINNQQCTQEHEKKGFQFEKHKYQKENIVLGVCAMKKKVQSKPMKQILSRLKCPQIKIIEMWEHLQSHWSSWPVVDALICFYSQGFPYLMACQYVKKHKPFLINSLKKQQLLWDRTVVYQILKKLKIPVAKHYFIIRDKNYINALQARGNGKIYQPTSTFSQLQHNKFQNTDSESEKIQETKKPRKFKQNYSVLTHVNSKENPLSEKKQFSSLTPISEEVVHHYPETIPSLSRTVKHRFSDVINGDQVELHSTSLLRTYHQRRKDKLLSYQVEQVEDHLLIKTGSEVHKLKKPFVQKPFDAENHQICIYYPQSMGGGRKKLFRKVKDCSSEYDLNQNCIRKDGNYIYQQFLPSNAFDIKVYTIGPYYMYAEARKSPTLDGVVQRNAEGKQMRYPVNLTPDEKFMCNRIVQEFQQEVCGFDLLRANGKSYVCDVNGWSFVKSNPKYWQDCSTILKKKIFHNFFPQKIRLNPNLNNFFINSQNQMKIPMNHLKPKVQQLRSIVSIFRHGDRSPKQKLKIKSKDKRFIEFFNNTQKDQLKFKDAKNLTKILQITDSIIAQSIQDHTHPPIKDFMQMKLVLQQGGHFQGLTRKLQLKVVQRQPTEDGSKGNIKTVLIVCKWGGQLSHFGYQDAIQLGKKMRIQRYDDRDCLSLYSSYKHDIKTYASDEGRCIKTAAAFLKGFLSIEGELAPIISSLVKTDHKAQRLLDCTSTQNHSDFADQLQIRLFDMLNSQEQLLKNYKSYCGQTKISDSMMKVILQIGKPRQQLFKLYKLIKNLVNAIEEVYLDKMEEEQLEEKITNTKNMEGQQKLKLVSSRWSKLKKDFLDSKTQKFNVSKLPQIYDTIRHDLRKSTEIFDLIDSQLKQGIHQLSKRFAYFFVINQYGIPDQERVKIAKDICLPLLEKVSVDLMFWKEKNNTEEYLKYADQEERYNERHIRTRLYFTSASHLYSLLNILTLGQNRFLLNNTPVAEAQKITNILYMSYLSHIEFKLYENLGLSQNHQNRFRLQISFSTQYKKQKSLIECSLGGQGFTIQQINNFINAFITQQNLSKSLLSNKSSQKSLKKKSDY